MRSRAVLFVLASMVSLTIGSSIAKALFPVLGAAGTTCLRLTIAATLVLVSRRPWRTPITCRQAQWVALYGAVLGLMNLSFYLAIARLPIGLAIGIEFLGPLLLALALSKNTLDLLWAALAFLGIALILPRSGAEAIDLVGVFFALCAAACWATYILVGKTAGRLVTPAQAIGYGMLTGALVVCPIGLTQAFAITEHPTLIGPAIAVGLLSSAVPYTLEMIALKDLDSKTFGILLSLEPAIGALAAFVILHERMSLLQLFAVACVITASAGATSFARQPAT